MDDSYSWNGGLRGTSSFRLPENEDLGKWIIVALIFAVVLHLVVIFGLSRIDVILPSLVERTTLQTKVVRVNPVDIDDSRPELTPPAASDPVEQTPVVPPADELDVLENLPEMDIDISPDIKNFEVPVAQSAAKGYFDGDSVEPLEIPNFEPDLPDMGKTEDFFPRSRDSQVTVDPGGRMVDKHDPDVYADILRKGAEGNADAGLLGGFTSLDAMARMDGNSILTSKALIGSDLLFDFNVHVLRQSARVSLMKVALLIDKHPNLICWVDGHTDLIGSDEPNLLLSQRRATAVKEWLVETLDLDEKRVAVRGFGKSSPLVKQGTVEEQAPNRRVEIKMRKTRPPQEVEVADPAKLSGQLEKNPSKAVPIDEDLVTPSPRAILEPEDEPSLAVPPRAIPVD